MQKPWFAIGNSADVQSNSRVPSFLVRAAHLPAAEQLHQDVASVPLVQQLADEVEVGDQGGLQDDGHVAGVEQLDGVAVGLTTRPLVAHWQIHPETLHAQAPPFQIQKERSSSCHSPSMTTKMLMYLREGVNRFVSLKTYGVEN